MNNNPSAVLFTLSVSVGVAMFGLGIIWPLLPVYATQMGAGGLLVGLIISSYNVSRTCLSPLVGRVSDRLGRKSFILTGLILSSIVSIAYVFCNTPAVVIGVRVVHGLASVMIVPIALALAGDIAPKEKLGTYMGTLNMAVMIGLGFGPSLGGLILQYIGMDAAFYSMSIASLLTVGLVAVFLPSDRESGAVTRKGGAATLREILANRTAFAILLMRFFAASGQGAVYTFLPVYALHVGMPGAQFGLILSINVFLIAIMQRPMGRLADRMNPRNIVIVGMFICAVSVFGMPFFAGFLPLLAFNVLMGFSNGFILPGSLTITGHLGRTMGMASLMSAADAAWSMGMIVSPILSGVVMDVWGITHVFTVGAMMIFVGSVVVTFLMAGYEPPAHQES